MKKLLKLLLKLIVFVVLLLLTYTVGSLLIGMIPCNDMETFKNPQLIYIRSNGVHTDICFEKKDISPNWNTLLDYSSFEMPEEKIQYVSFGWGDKGFYLDTPEWSDLKLSTALKAGFIPSATAMHISVLASTPKLDELTKEVEVSEEQIKLMERYIQEHLPQIENKAQLIDCCRYPGMDDNFYEANGSYSMFRTCNTWANQVLKAGKIRTAIWVAFDKSILYHF